jgi:transposase
MRTGRPKKPLAVKPADRERLEWLARRPKTAQRVAIRSKIILRAEEGLTNPEIARKLGVTGATVGKWRERYRVPGMEGLADEPRPGTPRKITDTQVAEAVTQTLESLPTAATHWSTRSLAEKVGLSQSAVVRIWHSFGLHGSPDRDVQIVYGSLFGGEGTVYRGSVFESAGTCDCPVRRREIAGASLGPDPADFTATTRSAGTTDPRLLAARHNFFVCGPGYRHRKSHLRVPPSPSPPGIPEVPERGGLQASARGPSGARQLRNA